MADLKARSERENPKFGQVAIAHHRGTRTPVLAVRAKYTSKVDIRLLNRVKRNLSMEIRNISMACYLFIC